MPVVRGCWGVGVPVEGGGVERSRKEQTVRNCSSMFSIAIKPCRRQFIFLFSPFLRL